MSSATVAITGATGLVGSAVVPLLSAAGYRVIRLVRREPRGADEARWDPDAGTVDPAAFAEAAAVVHLAAANIAERRWNAARKAEIRNSRVAGTATIAKAAAASPSRPALVCASAAGFYGLDTFDAVTEAAPNGTGFLAETCAAWEGAADPARAAGLRVVHLRIGLVLDPAGGALKEMLLPFKLGVAGRLGSGRQGFPWVSLRDTARAFAEAVTNPSLSGAYNLAAPDLCDNLRFTKTLGRVLRRPTLFPVPAFVLRILFGEIGAAVTRGRCLIPERLTAAGFRFEDSGLEALLRRTLNRPA